MGMVSDDGTTVRAAVRRGILCSTPASSFVSLVWNWSLM